MKRRIRKYSILGLLGIALPFVTLTSIIEAPGLAASLTSPSFRLTAPPKVMRSGQHIVFTLPVEKTGECEPVSPPYAAFTYRDGKNHDQRELFDLRGEDRRMLSIQPMLQSGEHAVLGPFLLFVTRDAAELATSFEVTVNCKSANGYSPVVVGSVALPDTSRNTGAELLDMLHGATATPSNGNIRLSSESAGDKQSLR